MKSLFSLAFFLGVVSALLATGCSDEGKSPAADAGSPDSAAVVPLACGAGTSGSLAAGGSVSVSGSQHLDLAGAGVFAPAGASAVALTVGCSTADSLLPSGLIALSPTVSFGPARSVQPVSLRLTLPYRPGLMPAKAGTGAIQVYWRRDKNDKPRNLPLLDPVIDATAGRVTFDLDELGEFQVGISARAGTLVKRKFSFRSIVGFSMGGGAAGVVGLRNPDKFDFIGPLGGEPGVNLIYFLSMLEQSFLAGFCTSDDEKAGTGKVGQLCPLTRKPLPGQHELLMSFEKHLYQAGQGVGLTLGRDLYMKGMRDILRAYGNPAYYNPADPFLPPGVPAAYLAQAGSAVCGKPYKLEKFYDREFNPDGSKPVITFCDSNDSSTLGKGVFDPSLPQTRPAQILLAVDLNGNGERDSGEPVVLHSHEPYKDVSSDGKADSEEAGYDAKANPDPAGDNFHYLKNPTGTEGNWRHDAGEPFEDVGIDGVKGTCQAAAGVDKCYDYGEGDGKFNWSPMVERWLKHDPYTLYASMSEAARQRLDIWADAGIRDFLNAHVATNGLLGQVAGTGQPVRIFESFEALQGAEAGKYFDFAQVDWQNVGKNAYVRYGDPTMDEKLVESTGDGRHVGTAAQIVNRTLSFFAMAQRRWPLGDRETKDIDITSENFKKDLTFKSPTTGQDRPFALFLPPGYFQAANKDRRYPVIYFLHGYGQSPDDLIALSTLFANYMVGPKVPDKDRFQKFIIVYVDGRCRPGGTLPVPSTGDGCEQGTFYLDSPAATTTARMETLLLELIDHIDKSYRTKSPAEVEIPSY